MPSAFAVSYEDLPDVFEVSGVRVEESGDIYCAGKRVEHSSVGGFQEFEGAYSAKLMDGSKELVSMDFPIVQHQDFDEEAMPFAFNMPYEEDADALVILDSRGVEKCRLERSKYAPDLKIKKFENGELEFEMSDEDEDYLLADIFVVMDGGREWIKVGGELTESSFTVSSAVKGVRVVVEDGFNSVSEEKFLSGFDEDSLYEDMDYEEVMKIVPVSSMDTWEVGDVDYEDEDEGVGGSDWDWDFDIPWMWIAIGLGVIVFVVVVVKFLKIILVIAGLILLAVGGFVVYELSSVGGGVPDYQPPVVEDKVDEVAKEPQSDKSLYEQYLEAYNKYSADPSEENLKKYSELKAAYQKDLYGDYEDELDNMEQGLPLEMDLEMVLENVEASSFLPDDKYDYSPYNAIDTNKKTAWVAGKPLGETIRFDFAREWSLDWFDLFPGYASSEETYFKNNRLKTVELEFSDGSVETVELDDAYYVHTLEFPNKVTTYVLIRVLDVYPGSKYNDTCISDVYF